MNEQNVLVITVDDGSNPYTEGLEAIQQLKNDDPVECRATIRFPNESQLTDVFNEHTYKLVRIIRDEEPASIRETARLVNRDKKNVHDELTTLEALGVIRFEEQERSKKPVFPYENLLVTPIAFRSNDSTPAAP